MALALVLRHPRTPWYAKTLLFVVVGYALSPIDLIPDFVPVLGYLDDLLLLPLGVSLALRLIPAPVMDECRRRAMANNADSPAAVWVVAASVALVWLVAVVLAAVAVVRWLST